MLNEIGLLIKQYMAESDISQKKLAVTIRMRTPRLNLILNGEHKLTTEVYAIICQGLGISAEYFINQWLKNRKKVA